ncbi:TPA: hypothetical protein I6W64_003686 [Vibrio cholerae]|nr:hypothetical protein [Vibrio cholerae]HAS2644568.1 hypothetical protein [Vibrio cholerae]
MLWFLTCVAALVGGYFIYGAFVEKVFGINEKRQTPAHTKTDGVDCTDVHPKSLSRTITEHRRCWSYLWSNHGCAVRSSRHAVDRSWLYLRGCSTRLLLRYAFYP